MGEQKVNRNFKGVWIPEEIIKKHGIKKAILISAFIQNAPGLSKRQIREANKILSIHKFNPQEIKDYILGKDGNRECEWCHNYSHSLQEHHYPIPKKDGGDKIVKICGKCHSDYHFIENFGIIDAKIKGYYEEY